MVSGFLVGRWRRRDTIILRAARIVSMPSAIDPALEPRRVPEVVEMGDRLAHREVALLDVELAAEEHRERARRRRAARRPQRTASSSSAESRARDARAAAPTRSGMPRNGSPCDGSTSVSGGSAVERRDANRRNRAQRIAVGLDGA